MSKFGLLLLAGVAMGHPYGVYNNYDQLGGQRHGGYGYGAPVVQQQQGYFGAGFNPSQQAQFSPYHHEFSHNQAGANFFKQEDEEKSIEFEEEELEQLPYTVTEDFGTYELREYPEAKFACVKSEVDNSEDPLAGLEKMNPFEIMRSKRWKTHPNGIMFKELFKYIAGVNKDRQEIEMTRPVSTHHSIKKKQVGGDVEVQEMCFYITSEFQANPPQPLDNSPVFIYQRPAMKVYSRQFGGFPMTSATWIQEKQVLENLLADKPHHDSEYYTLGYNSPWDKNRRNEVWIQCLEPAAPVIAAVVAEVQDENDSIFIDIDNQKLAEVAELEKENDKMKKAEEEKEVSEEVAEVDPKDAADTEAEAEEEADAAIEVDADTKAAETEPEIDAEAAETESETDAEVAETEEEVVDEAETADA